MTEFKYTSAKAEFTLTTSTIDTAWQMVVEGFQEQHRLFYFIGGSAILVSDPVGDTSSPVLDHLYEFKKHMGTPVTLQIINCIPNQNLTFLEYFGVKKHDIRTHRPNLLRILLAETRSGIEFTFERVDGVYAQKKSSLEKFYSALFWMFKSEEKYHRSSAILDWTLPNFIGRYQMSADLIITKDCVDPELLTLWLDMTERGYIQASCR